MTFESKLSTLQNKWIHVLNSYSNTCISQMKWLVDFSLLQKKKLLQILKRWFRNWIWKSTYYWLWRRKQLYLVWFKHHPCSCHNFKGLDHQKWRLRKSGGIFPAANWQARPVSVPCPFQSNPCKLKRNLKGGSCGLLTLRIRIAFGQSFRLMYRIWNNDGILYCLIGMWCALVT